MHSKVKTLETIQQIESTKAKLHKLIKEKEYNLVDPEVIKLSQLLDKLISEYHDIK